MGQPRFGAQKSLLVIVVGNPDFLLAGHETRYSRDPLIFKEAKLNNSSLLHSMFMATVKPLLFCFVEGGALGATPRCTQGSLLALLIWGAGDSNQAQPHTRQVL